jgi:hypothetical protein
MAPAPRPGHSRVAFDESFWTQDLARATAAGRRTAEAWRAASARDGVRRR